MPNKLNRAAKKPRAPLRRSKPPAPSAASPMASTSKTQIITESPPPTFNDCVWFELPKEFGYDPTPRELLPALIAYFDLVKEEAAPGDRDFERIKDVDMSHYNFRLLGDRKTVIGILNEAGQLAHPEYKTT